MGISIFGNNEPAENKSKKRWIPKDDYGVLAACRSICANGLEYVDHLGWITSVEFETEVGRFDELLSRRYSTSADIKYSVEVKADMIGTILNAAKHVLNYADEEDSLHKESDCLKMGFVGRVFPTTQNLILEAVEKMVTHLPSMPYADRRYGLVFWQDILTKLQALNPERSTTESNLSANVDEKNAVKEELRKVMQSTIYIIRGRFPDNQDAMIRNAGFSRK